LRSHGNNAVPPSPSTSMLVSAGRASSVATNVAQLKLLHHFQACTSRTLVFAVEAWEYALQLCQHFDFLKDAILCVASRHLSTLQPQDPTHRTAATNHLCRCLYVLRQELSKGFRSMHIDAFIATSILLQGEIWANTDCCMLQDDGSISFDPSRDQLFTFAASVKRVFLKSVPPTTDQPSKFRSFVRSSPVGALETSAKVSNATLANYQETFSYSRPLNPELLLVPLPYIRGMDLADLNPMSKLASMDRGCSDPIQDGYVPIVSRLCLILSFLPEADPPSSVSESALLAQLVRYVFLFPISCYGHFATMIGRGDPHALLLLYHFYRAVRILLPSEDCWWAHTRAALSEAALKEWLLREHML
jgi:hypothetical protein